MIVTLQHAGHTPRFKRLARRLASMRCKLGSMTIETTLGFMIMMVMVLGIMELSMMAYTYSVLSEAAREGVRYASVHGSDSSSCSGPSSGCDATATAVINDVKTYAKNFAGNVTNMQVNVTYPDGLSTGTSLVKVTVTEVYQPVFHYPGAAHTLTVSSTGRILY